MLAAKPGEVRYVPNFLSDENVVEFVIVLHGFGHHCCMSRLLIVPPNAHFRVQPNWVRRVVLPPKLGIAVKHERHRYLDLCTDKHTTKLTEQKN